VRRREFIALIGGAAAWPLASHSQQMALPKVGFPDDQYDRLPALAAELVNQRVAASAEGYASMAAAFREGLKETGRLC
jgi:hypothetical protein